MIAICALSALWIANLPHVTIGQNTQSFGSDLPFDPFATSEQRKLRAEVIDFLGRNDLAGKKSVKQKKQPSAVTQSPAKALAPEKKSVESKSPKTAARRPSPFQKWVKPQKSTSLVEVTDAPEQKQAEPTVTKSADNKPGEALAMRANRRSAPLPESKSTNKTVAKSKTPAIPPKTSSAVATPNVVATDLPKLTRSQQNLRTKVRRVLTHYYNRPLNTRDRSPWEIMHAMLAYEVHSKVLQGGPQGDPITAVGWLCFNRDCKRRSLMYVNDEGKLRVRVGPALQGHKGQLLAMLAQAKVSREYPMLVDQQDFTVADLIKMEMETCYPRTELTFKLIGLMHYLDTEATWMNDQGMQWNIPRLISEEIRQPVRGAACGGTHRLSGLTLAYKTREKRGEPIDGEYLRAQRFVRRYQQYAYKLQNNDGSFSTEWFRGPGNENSIDRKLKTTGHTLEWLLYAATDKELQHWRTTKAVNYLATIMYNNRYKDWETGPLGHAIHALLLYDRMMYQPYDAPGDGPLALKQEPIRQSRGRR